MFGQSVLWETTLIGDFLDIPQQQVDHSLDHRRRWQTVNQKEQATSTHPREYEMQPKQWTCTVEVIEVVSTKII